MLILVLLAMYFDAVVVFVTSQTFFFRLALAILWLFLDILQSVLIGGLWTHQRLVCFTRYEWALCKLGSFKYYLGRL